MTKATATTVSEAARQSAAPKPKKSASSSSRKSKSSVRRHGSRSNATSRRSPLFMTCTHTTVTRLFTRNLGCDVCGKPPPWGWLYQCTQDVEPSLRNNIVNGKPSSAFDSLGELLGIYVEPIREKSLEKISSEYKALPDTALSGAVTYTGNQLDIILKQRENVRKVIRQQLMTEADSQRPAQRRSRALVRGPSLNGECKLKACHSCRQTFRHRSYLSLDAVVDGNVPATAATGWGFHQGGGHRPLADASIVSRLGLRPVPEVATSSPSSPASSNSSLASSVLDNTTDDSQDKTELPKMEISKILKLRSTTPHTGPVLRRAPRPVLPARPLPPIPIGNTVNDAQTDKPVPHSKTAMEEAEEASGTFSAEPLDVADGVAVTEEGVDTGVADILTQV